MFDNYITQSSLGGEYERIYKAGDNIDRIVMGEVKKVNYRYHTVDIELIKDRTILGSSPETRGRYAARLPVQFSGTTATGKAYGQVNPIQVGSLVLVGFVGGKKTLPMVLGIYGRTEESYNLSRSPIDAVEAKDTELEEYTSNQFTLYPSLTFDSVDGNGGRTVTFSGKSFLVMDAESDENMSGITDSAEGTEYAQLSDSTYYTGELIEPTNTKAPVILFKHQGSNTKNKFLWFLDKDGTHRVSTMREGEDWKSYFEISKEGAIRLRKQGDSTNPGEGSDVSEIIVDDDIVIRAGTTYFKVNKNGDVETSRGVIGGGGGSGVSEELATDLENLKKGITELSTQYEQNSEFIRLSAKRLEEHEGTLVAHDAEFKVMADNISQKVSSLEVTNIVEEGLKTAKANIESLMVQAEDTLGAIADLAVDNNLTPIDKKVLAIEWERIVYEYPGYIAQMDTLEMPSEAYTSAYDDLKSYLEPLLIERDKTSVIDRTELILLFSTYYEQRNNVALGVFNQIHAEILALAQEVADAGVAAGSALTASRDATTLAGNATTAIENMENSEIATPQDKVILRREIRELLHGAESTKTQAIEYGLDVTGLEGAIEGLNDYITTIGLFTDMQASTAITSATLTGHIEALYTTQTALLEEITTQTKQLIEDIGVDVESHTTAIKENARQISLSADSVVALGAQVKVNQAVMLLQSDRIISRVTSNTWQRDTIKQTSLTDRYARNLYVIKSTKPVGLSATGGETSTTIGQETSDYIETLSGDTYTLTIKNAPIGSKVVLAWYDDMKEHRENFEAYTENAHQVYTEKVPTGGGYVRVSVANAKDAQIKFERGIAATSYDLAPEDVLGDVEQAQVSLQARKTAYGIVESFVAEVVSSSAEQTVQLHDVTTDKVITVAEKVIVKAILDKVNATHTQVLAYASEYGLNTIAYTGAYASFKAKLEEYTDNMTADTTLTSVGFVGSDTFFKTRQTLIESTESHAKGRLDDAERVVSELLKTALDAEWLASRLEGDLSYAQKNLGLLRDTQQEYSKNRTDLTARVVQVVTDSIFSPKEKADMLPELNYIRTAHRDLRSYLNLYSISDLDVTNAFNTLDAYMSGMLAIDQIVEDSEINAQTFTQNFESFFQARETVIGLLITEAEAKVQQLGGIVDRAKVQYELRKGDLAETGGQAQAVLDRVNAQLPNLIAGSSAETVKASVENLYRSIRESTATYREQYLYFSNSPALADAQYVPMGDILNLVEQQVSTGTFFTKYEGIMTYPAGEVIPQPQVDAFVAQLDSLMELLHTLSEEVVKLSDLIADKKAKDAEAGAKVYTDAAITILNDAIKLKVDVNGVISAINLYEGTATIDAKHINLNGKVTINAFAPEVKQELDDKATKEDIKRKINNAVTTIDETGVTVKDGSFFLEDDQSIEKYSLQTKTNMLEDHGFEMIQPDIKNTWFGLSNSVFEIKKEVNYGYSKTIYSHTALGTYSIFMVNSPKIFVSYLSDQNTDTSIRPIFGEASGVVNSSDYLEMKVSTKIVPSRTYCLSAFFKKIPLTVCGVPNLTVIRHRFNNSGGTNSQVATRTFPQVTNEIDATRNVLSFTAPSDYNVKTDHLRIQFRSGNEKWVMVDGAQLVEGSHPTQYAEDSTAFGIASGKYPLRDINAEHLTAEKSFVSKESAHFQKGLSLDSEWGDSLVFDSQHDNAHNYISWQNKTGQRRVFFGIRNRTTKDITLINENGGNLDFWGKELMYNGIAIADNKLNASSGEVLWLGAFYMNRSQTVVPSVPMSGCQNGWMLRWNPYSNGVVQNHSYNYSYIHKAHAIHAGGTKGTYVSMTTDPNLRILKYLYIYDGHIEGYNTNGTEGNQSMVLTGVFAW